MQAALFAVFLALVFSCTLIHGQILDYSVIIENHSEECLAYYSGVSCPSVQSALTLLTGTILNDETFNYSIDTLYVVVNLQLISEEFVECELHFDVPNVEYRYFFLNISSPIGSTISCNESDSHQFSFYKGTILSGLGFQHVKLIGVSLLIEYELDIDIDSCLLYKSSIFVKPYLPNAQDKYKGTFRGSVTKSLAIDTTLAFVNFDSFKLENVQHTKVLEGLEGTSGLTIQKVSGVVLHNFHSQTLVMISQVDAVDIGSSKFYSESVLIVNDAALGMTISNSSFSGTYKRQVSVVSVRFTHSLLIYDCIVDSVNNQWLKVSAVNEFYMVNVDISNCQTANPMVFVNSCQLFVVSRSTFSNIRSKSVLWLDNFQTFSIVHSQFDNCESGEYSGAIYCSMQQIIMPTSYYNGLISGTTFQNCKGINGGAIHFTGFGPLLINDCIFQNNQAVSGGAVYFSSMELIKIMETSFEGNQVICLDKCGHGGALWLQGKAKMLKTKFIRNKAWLGGSVYYGFDKLWYLHQKQELSGAFVDVVENEAHFGSFIYSEIGPDVSISDVESSLNTHSIGFKASPCVAFNISILGNTTIFPGQNLSFTIQPWDVFGNIYTEAFTETIISTESGLQVMDYTHGYSLEKVFTIFLENTTDVLFPYSFDITIQFDEGVMYVPLTIVDCPDGYYLINQQFCQLEQQSSFDTSTFIMTYMVAFVVGLTCICCTCLFIIALYWRKASAKLRKREMAEIELEQRILDQQVVFEHSDETHHEITNNLMISVEDIKIKKRIGEGGQSVVYLATLVFYIFIFNYFTKMEGY